MLEFVIAYAKYDGKRRPTEARDSVYADMMVLSACPCQARVLSVGALGLLPQPFSLTRWTGTPQPRLGCL